MIILPSIYVVEFFYLLNSAFLKDFGGVQKERLRMPNVFSFVISGLFI